MLRDRDENGLRPDCYDRHIDGDGTVFVSGVLRGPYLKCEGGTIELLASDNGDRWSDDASTGRFAIEHDGTSNLIVVTYGARGQQGAFSKSDPPESVPIEYRPARPGMKAKFDASSCPWAGRAVINAAVFDNSGGNVFSGIPSKWIIYTTPDGTTAVSNRGDYRAITCEGGTVELSRRR